MNKDERDLLDVLKFELEFLEKGGYGRSPREPWRPRFIFEDSPTCMNYDSKDHPDPCEECVLMQLVPLEFRGAKIPCRHIPFNSEGESLDSLYRYADQSETEDVFRNWLKATIARLEDERSPHLDTTVGPPAPGAAESKGEPLFHSPHPKCANPACLTTFHWLCGGKFFRFRPDAPTCHSECQELEVPTGAHGVQHYWLCERCAHAFSLVYDESHGVVLKVLRSELYVGGGASPKHLNAA